MIINKFYLFIKNELYTKKVWKNLSGQCFQLNQNLEGRQYILYNLPLLPTTLILKTEKGSFYLKSHHVSFYEFQDDHDPRLSQYHYTAYFNDQDSKEYQLHVYFNQNDQLTTEPVFSFRNETNQYSNMTVDNKFSENLIWLAIDKSFAIIAELRKQQQDGLLVFEKDYAALERQLEDFSIDLATHYEVYQTLLQETLQVLQYLADYHDNSQYEVLLNLFKKIEKSLAIQKTTLVEQNVMDDESISDSDTLSSITITKKLHHESKIKEKSQLLQAAVTAKDLLLSSKNDVYDNQVTRFLAFHDRLADLLLLATHENSEMSSDDLQHIQSLMSIKSSKAKELLIELLLKNQFELAYHLRQFANLIPDNCFRIALMKGNARLLDFLLTHKHFAINTFIVRDNLSPVLFCFLKNNEEVPQVDCLSVLIKHHASIFIAAPDGLPVAHHIFNNSNHPLRKALIDNTATALGRKSFYQSLVNSIECYLANHSVEDSVKNILLFSMETYKIAMTDLPGQHSVIHDKAIQKTQSTVCKIASHFSQEELNAVKADRDVTARFKKYCSACQQYKAKLSKREQYQLNVQNNLTLDNINQLLDHIQPSTENLKQEVLQILNSLIDVIHLKEELLDVQKTICSKTINKKERNNAEQRQKEILNELNGLLEGKLFFLSHPQEVRDLLSMEKNLQKVRDLLSMKKNLQNNLEATQISMSHLHSLFKNEEANCEQLEAAFRDLEITSEGFFAALPL